MATPRIDDDDDRAPNVSATKKPYRAPELIPWGTLREITGAVGTTGKNDAGTKSANKTI